MESLKSPSGRTMIWAMCTIIFLGSFGSYVIALVRGQIRPFLPYISDAGSVPPQSALLNLSIVAVAFCGIFPTLMLRTWVRQQNSRKDKAIHRMNEVASAFALISAIGIVFAGAFPLGGQREKLSFLYITLIPHLFGGGAAMTGYSAYIILHLLISYRLGKATRKMLIFRTTFALIVVVSLACVVIPLRKALPWLSGDYVYSEKCTDDKLIGQYTVDYNVSAVAEWSLLFGLIASILTYTNDLKEYYVDIRIRGTNTEEDDFVKTGIEMARSDIK